MLKLSIHPRRRHRLPLGAIVRLTVKRKKSDVEARVLLRQGPVLYPRPVADWGPAEEPILIFPESPGDYVIEASWRRPSGESGRERLEFTVLADAPAEAGPARVELEHFGLWIASAFEAEAFESTDRDVGQLLAGLVSPGQTVYDLGANVGFYTSHFARLVGEGGRVIAFEANPVCSYFLRTNVLDQRLGQVTVLPTALLHVDGMTRFIVNYGNTNLGLVETSGFFQVKAGQEIVVSCFTLDHLVRDLGLPAPDVIKVDVEGAEVYVMDGMTRILEEHRPLLLLELHGRAYAPGVISKLAALGYLFEDQAAPGEVHAGAAALEAFGADEVHQVIARHAG